MRDDILLIEKRGCIAFHIGPGFVGGDRSRG